MSTTKPVTSFKTKQKRVFDWKLYSFILAFQSGFYSCLYLIPKKLRQFEVAVHSDSLYEKIASKVCGII